MESGINRLTALQVYQGDQSDFNCGGFALGTFDWVTPYDKNSNPISTYTVDNRVAIMESLATQGKTDEEITEAILQLDVQYLLETYPSIQLANPNDVADDEVLIAYRVFVLKGYDGDLIEDTDFHFKVRIGGFWFEKRGYELVHLCDENDWSYEFSDLETEGLEYFSRIVYFKDSNI